MRDQEYQRYYSSTRSRRPFSDDTGESQATEWINFFLDKMGRFLRNAAIYHYPGGMVQFYKDQGVIPQVAIATGTVGLSRQLRLTSSEAQNANNTINKQSDTPNALPNLVEVFGWYPPPQPENALSDGSPRWLLIVDTNNRLLWVASDAIDVGTTDVETYPQADIATLSPAIAYIESDLQIILGS